MPIIPISSSGIAAQYPVATGKRFHSSSVRFLDGTMQSFQNRSQPSIQWGMWFANQREELSIWLPFLENTLHNDLSFEFIDPVTGLALSEAKLHGDGFDLNQSVTGAQLSIQVRSEGT